MIKEHRVKFICVIMAIVMVMLDIILGVVFYFTAESIKMMRGIAFYPFQQGILGTPAEEVRLPFFTV